MSETLLKKDFQNKDINRVRNLITKNFTGKTSTSVGYDKIHTQHLEGDVWEEDGRMWTIKDGIKQNITKLDQFKELVKIPLTCPRCGGPMSHWLAKKMYRIHGFCFDPCTVEYEAQLRKVGLFEEYEKKMITGNIKTFAKDVEQWILDNVDSKETYVTEQGDIEEWSSNSSLQKEKIISNLKDFLEHINSKVDI